MQSFCHSFNTTATGSCTQLAHLNTARPITHTLNRHRIHIKTILFTHACVKLLLNYMCYISDVHNYD